MDWMIYCLATRSSPTKFLNDKATINPEYLTWTRLNQFLLSWILSSIYENMLAHVIHYSTSSEVWKLLEQLFFTKSKARLLHLRFLLQTTKKGSLTIEDYILKMKSLAHEFMSVGQVIPDYEIVLYILGGLGPEYESVVVNLTSKDSLTLPEAQFMLQAHELRLENFHNALALDLTAATTQISLNHTNFHNTNQSSLFSISPRGSFSSSRGRN